MLQYAPNQREISNGCFNLGALHIEYGSPKRNEFETEENQTTLWPSQSELIFKSLLLSVHDHGLLNQKFGLKPEDSRQCKQWAVFIVRQLTALLQIFTYP